MNEVEALKVKVSQIYLLFVSQNCKTIYADVHFKFQDYWSRSTKFFSFVI